MKTFLVRFPSSQMEYNIRLNDTTSIKRARDKLGTFLSNFFLLLVWFLIKRFVFLFVFASVSLFFFFYRDPF